jgi:hypothetical protein
MSDIDTVREALRQKWMGYHIRYDDALAALDRVEAVVEAAKKLDYFLEHELGLSWTDDSYTQSYVSAADSFQLEEVHGEALRTALSNLGGEDK